MKKRIIPFLMLHDEQLHKSQQFDSNTYIGDPIIAMKIFNEKEAEEICVVDIDPSRNNTPINFNLLKEIASEAFMPLSYGGGIKNIQQAEKLLYTGIEKLMINSASIENNGAFIRELVKEFGTSTIVCAMDYKKSKNDNIVFIRGGQKNTGIKVIDHIKRMTDLGVGEIFINSIERDGMMQGLDLAFIKSISPTLSSPLVAGGGAGSLEDIQNGFKAGAEAIAVGSLFVYKGPLKAVLINYPDKSQADQLRIFEDAGV